LGGAANLGNHAAEQFFAATGLPGRVAIHIKKIIPVAAGLGGGSSDAAAVLMGLNRYFNHPFSRNRLLVLGAALGADVPFFVHQKPVIASGIGDILTDYKELGSFHLVLVSPGFEVSTAAIFKDLNLRLTNCKKILKSFCFSKQIFDVSRHLCNDLETVTEPRYPEIAAVKAAMLDLGADGALMSGSGPTVFGVFGKAGQAHRAYRRLKTDHPLWQVFLTDPIL
jgi:4-diphosphocytidyl-2-C-methyl-D-erythritol kinase